MRPMRPIYIEKCMHFGTETSDLNSEDDLNFAGFHYCSRNYMRCFPFFVAKPISAKVIQQRKLFIYKLNNALKYSEVVVFSLCFSNFTMTCYVDFITTRLHFSSVKIKHCKRV